MMEQHVWIVQDRPSDEGRVLAAFTSKKSAYDYAARIDRERGWGYGHETWVAQVGLDPGLPTGQPDECPICGGQLRAEWVESEDDVVRAGRWACQSNDEHFVEMKVSAGGTDAMWASTRTACGTVSRSRHTGQAMTLRPSEWR